MYTSGTTGQARGAVLTRSCADRLGAGQRGQHGLAAGRLLAAGDADRARRRPVDPDALPDRAARGRARAELRRGAGAGLDRAVAHDAGVDGADDAGAGVRAVSRLASAAVPARDPGRRRRGAAAAAEGSGEAQGADRPHVRLHRDVLAGRRHAVRRSASTPRRAARVVRCRAPRCAWSTGASRCAGRCGWRAISAARRSLRRRGSTRATSACSIAHGGLHVRARRADLIVSGGENVYPAEVERVLEACHGIRAAAVFGVPDETWGQIVAAAFVADGTPPTDEELVAFLDHHLARHKRPRRIAFVRDCRRRARGKLDRAGLAALAVAVAAADRVAGGCRLAPAAGCGAPRLRAPSARACFCRQVLLAGRGSFDIPSRSIAARVLTLRGPPPSRNFNARCLTVAPRGTPQPAAAPCFVACDGARESASTSAGAPIVVRGASRSAAQCGGRAMGRAAGPSGSLAPEPQWRSAGMSKLQARNEPVGCMTPAASRAERGTRATVGAQGKQVAPQS